MYEVASLSPPVPLTNKEHVISNLNVFFHIASSDTNGAACLQTRPMTNNINGKPGQRDTGTTSKAYFLKMALADTNGYFR